MLHETLHVRNHDNLKKVFVQVILCIYWWMLPLYVYAKQLQLIQELHVDEQILKLVTDKDEYLNVLISVKRKLQQRTENVTISRKASSMFITYNESVLERRIKFILEGFTFKRTNVLLLLTIIIIPLTCTSIIVEPYKEPSRKNDTSTEFDVRGSYLYFTKKGQYYLYQNGSRIGRISNPKDPMVRSLKVIYER